ncbi:MAG TPA: nodulation protein NfeD [Casimicrobiaceae bacterium]
MLALAALLVARAALGAAVIDVIPVTGAIGPATADFVVRGIERAEQEGSELVVLRIDTPGGLDTSMRDIIKVILAARVPIASFVAPSGARAASAGTYIMYASPVAAMAPGTNLGAATPVAIGGPESPGPPVAAPSDEKNDRKDENGKSDKEGASAKGDKSETAMTRKQVHDAAAYIRSLAQLRGRNADWAERAVREAVSLSAEEALKQHVVDVVASDVADLAKKLDGRTVKVAGAERTLHTADASISTLEPDWRTRFLAIITHPSIALILLTVGFYGLVFEFMNPGMVLPGVAGAIALLIGLYALQLLPISYAGLALVVLGLGFIVAEVFLPTYGSLGVGGVIAFVVGAMMLIDTDIPAFGVPLSLIVLLALATVTFVFAVGGAALKARRRPVVSGREQLIGTVGVVLDETDGETWARVHSERWRVRSTEPLLLGQRVRVTGRDGLVLTVAPIHEGG